MFGGNTGYQPVSMIESSNPRFNQPQPKKHKPIFVIIAIAACVILIIAVIIAVIIYKNTTGNSGGGGEDYSSLTPEEDTDDTDEEDVLNSRLAELVKYDPNANYQTKSTLVDWSSKQIYDDIKVAINEEKFNEQYILDHYPNATEVKAMNSNIINYYLDKGYLVAISAKGSHPFSKDGKTILIYGSQPVERYFFACRYEVYNNGGKAVEDTLASKDLFDAMQSNEKFYAIGVR